MNDRQGVVSVEAPGSLVRTGPVGVRVLVSCVVAGLLLGGCAGAADVDDLSATTTAVDTTADEPTSTTSKRSDLGIAEGAVLRIEDLPEGWVECCPPEIPLADQLREHICGSPEGLEPRTAAYVRQYSLNLRPDGNEDGHLLAAVYLSGTEEAASAEFAGVDAGSYEACMVEGVIETAAGYRPDRTGAPSVTFERAPLSLEVPASLDRFVAEVPVGTQIARMYTSILRLRVGRALVRIEINTFAEPTSTELLRDLGARSVELARESLVGE